MIHQFQQFFNNDFTDYTSFLNQVLFPVFGENKFEKGYDVLTQDSEIKQKASEANIEEIKHVGTFSTDLAADIKLFEVVLSDNCQIERSRINIQQLIRRYVETFEGAFMVFHYQNPENRSWRFSYVEKRTSAVDSTSAKRYTYLLGKTFACRTAAQRFNDLYKLQQNITLQDITDAFSVEALSDEFFDKYRSLYADFIQFITGKRYEKEKGKWVENVKHQPDAQFQRVFEGNDKAVRDYAKKMMGRLVFLQFLQKKGWLGVPLDKTWGEGDSNYMEQLFANSSHKDNFLEAVLEPLFFETLNNGERINEIADTRLGKNIKIPYLNGGLFEKDELDKKIVVFPACYFEKLFNFFGEYNFTIDENDPNDAELGVDPEMLGRIFENLLEDNKDKGAYYTPKEIVQYMCRESLIAYLCTGNETDEESIKELVLQHKADSLSDSLKQTLDQKLKDLKVCDPAIGSGAFPMGMMNEIFKCRIAIEGVTDNAVEIKKHIIQNNIYGVDIENGAVDIARLRFWLALVVDETEPKPLPNLDYKIMQGNSLLESYQNIDLSQLTKQTKERVGKVSLTIFDNELDLLRKKLSEKINKYFDCSPADKQQIKAEITLNILSQIKEDKLNIDLSGIDVSANTHFFLWHTFFADVFKNGGFDIVIGNPPYVNISNLKPDAYRKKLVSLFTTAKNKSDLYSFFTEKGIQLLKDSGVLCYIIPHTWKATDSFVKLRELIFSNTMLLKAVNLNMGVFDAIVQPMIIVLKNAKNTNYEIDILNKEFTKTQSINISEILSSEEYFFDTTATNSEKAIFKKIESNSIRLETIIKFSRGIKTSDDKRFILSDKENEDCKKIFRGRNVKAYTLNWTNEYIWYRPDLMKEKVGCVPYSSTFFEVPEKIVLQRVNSSFQLLATIDVEGNYFLDTTIISIYDTWDKKTSLKYICGLLNSKLLNYWYCNKYRMPTIGIYEISSIPIKVYQNQQPLISLVDYILYLKKVEIPLVSNIVSNEVIASYFEKVIDACVYELYFENEIKTAQVDVMDLVGQSLAKVSSLPMEQQIFRLYEEWNEYKSEVRNSII